MAIRRDPRAVGKKFGGLLQGLLGGLYDTSAVEPNEGYLPAGTEGPAPKGGNVPFKGTGLFGKLKAGQANTDFVGQNLLADADSVRQLEFQQNLNKAKIAQDEAALGQEGEAAFDVYGRLPATSQTLGPVGSLPPAYADVARLFQAAGGGVTGAKGIAGLGPYVAEQNLTGAALADPKALDWKKGSMAKEGFMNIGGDTHVNPATNEALYGRQTSNIQEVLPIYEDKFDFTTGTVKPTITGYKTTSRPVTTPARSGTIGKSFTQEKLDMFKDPMQAEEEVVDTNITAQPIAGPKGVSNITPTQPAPTGVSPKAEKPMQSLNTVPEVSAISRGVSPKGGGELDLSNIFSLEAQGGAEAEFIRRLIKKLQTQAWNPVDYSNPNLIP